MARKYVELGRFSAVVGMVDERLKTASPDGKVLSIGDCVAAEWPMISKWLADGWPVSKCAEYISDASEGVFSKIVISKAINKARRAMELPAGVNAVAGDGLVGFAVGPGGCVGRARELSPVARSLADYVMSYKQPMPLALEKLEEMCAEHDGDATSWRQAVERACAEIVAAKVADTARLGEDGMIRVRR
jgi:hypothetical protein